MTETRADWCDLADDELLVRLRQRGAPERDSRMLVLRRDHIQIALDIDDVIDRGW